MSQPLRHLVTASAHWARILQRKPTEATSMASACLEVLACIATVSSTLTWLFARSVFHVLRRIPQPLQTFPGITVLKPLKGVDDGLLANLRALAQQDYPPFEIIFGTADPHGPARAVVEQFVREHPHLPAKVRWGHPAFGLNPKVSNLEHMARLAQYDVYLISDANVRLQPHALRTLAADLPDDVGLVCTSSEAWTPKPWALWRSACT